MLGGTSEQPATREYSNLSEGFAAYWRFAGLGARINAVDKTLPFALDIVVFSVLSLFLFRTTVANPSTLALGVAGLLVAYGVIAFLGGEHGMSRRLTALTLIAFFLGVAMPLRIGEPLMVMSFFVTLGCVSSFVRFGTRITLATVLVYVVLAAYLVVEQGWGDGSLNFALSGSIAFAGAALLLTLMLYNAFLVAREDEFELMEARESIARLSSLSHIGYYWWDTRTDVWVMNEVYREIMMLPEDQFPVVKIDDVFSRVDESIREGLIARLRQFEDMDTVKLVLNMPDGTLRDIMAHSKVYRHEDGHLVRHGFIWRAENIAAAQAG